MASKSSMPPYSSAARISDSPCFPQYTASLKCLEEFSSEKSKCQEHFDVYKECKKKEIYAIHQSIPNLQKYVEEQSKKEIKDIIVSYDHTFLVANPRRCKPKKFVGRGAPARVQKSYR